MKKLLFTLAITALTASSHAAVATWNSGVVFGPSDDSGTITTGAAYKLADTSTAAMYVFILADADAYAKVQSDGVYKTYSSSLSSAKASTTTLASSKFSALKTGDYVAGESIYAAILFTYTDSAGKNWYLENTATATVDDLGSDIALSNLARYQGGKNTGGQLASWSSNVPEPTSAMLLLLGFAGLALKRKNA